MQHAETVCSMEAAQYATCRYNMQVQYAGCRSNMLLVQYADTLCRYNIQYAACRCSQYAAYRMQVQHAECSCIMQVQYAVPEQRVLRVVTKYTLFWARTSNSPERLPDTPISSAPFP